MDYIEVKAKTIDDAITDALVQLGITSDQLDYEVIEKGSAGILGLGRKDAVIKARKKITVPEKKPERTAEKKPEVPVQKKEKKISEKSPAVVDFSVLERTVKDFLTQVFAAMQLEVEIVTKVDEENRVIDVDFKGPEMKHGLWFWI